MKKPYYRITNFYIKGSWTEKCEIRENQPVLETMRKMIEKYGAIIVEYIE